MDDRKLNNRASDTSQAAKLADNANLKAAHMVVTLLLPVIMTIGGWVFITAYNSETKKLEDNTQAISELKNVVLSRNAYYDTELTDHDRRLNHLEDLVYAAPYTEPERKHNGPHQ